MARLTKVYYSRFHRQKPNRLDMEEDEVRTFQVDFNGGLESGESVSTATMETEDDTVLAISGETLSSGLASVTGTASTVGAARLSFLATLSSGRKLKQWFRIRVIDEADVR